MVQKSQNTAKQSPASAGPICGLPLFLRYNQVVVGALVSFEALTDLLPLLDTVLASDSLRSYRSLVQGTYISFLAFDAPLGLAFAASMHQVWAAEAVRLI
jgi:hypothetical protein